MKYYFMAYAFFDVSGDGTLGSCFATASFIVDEFLYARQSAMAYYFRSERASGATMCGIGCKFNE